MVKRIVGNTYSDKLFEGPDFSELCNPLVCYHCGNELNAECHQKYIESKDKFVFMIYDDGKSMNEEKLMDAMKLGSSDKNYKNNDCLLIYC